MKKALVSFSGGMDSATCLARAVQKYDEVVAIGFLYGSKHNRWENEKAKQFAEHYKVPFSTIDISTAMKEFKSNLLLSGAEIPEGHYQAANMSLTVVPGRNLIFSALLAGYAESQKIDEIVLGVHQGDHVIYPDCRIEFIDSLRQTIALSSDGKVAVWTPFIDGDKTTILKWGFENNVPYHLTRTCYKDQEDSCGKCGSCQERLEAFKSIGRIDPIKYEA